MERSFQVHRNAVTKHPADIAEWRETRGMHPVESIRVNAETWARAVKEADGDRRRIQILSENSVIIWNSVEQKAEMTVERGRRANRR